MSHTEADRKAFYRDLAKKEHQERVNKFLAANPDVGILNSGVMYRMSGGEMHPLTESEYVNGLS